MNRNRIVIIAIAALLVVGAGLWAFNSVLGGYPTRQRPDDRYSCCSTAHQCAGSDR
jgi:hypothetical protein